MQVQDGKLLHRRPPLDRQRTKNTLHIIPKRGIKIYYNTFFSTILY